MSRVPASRTPALGQPAPPLRVRRPDGGEPGRDLVGRTHERRTLDRLLDDLRTGRSGALVVLGDAGVGKTALLGHLRRRATGCRVIAITAAASERDLDFAALHQLCRPLLSGIERLPEPQRAALRIALGLAAGIAPDRLRLGLAVLGLLAAAAEDRPLVCLVDDAHRLDAASSAVLGVAARRLGSERVLLAFGARGTGPDLADLPHLSVPELTDGEARALLASALGGPLDERVRERLIAEAGRNPAALLAVARGSTAARLAGGFGHPDAGAGPSRIDAGHARRFGALSDETRQLLLIAAAEPLGEPLLLWRAAEHLGIPPAAADAAQDAGLLEVGTRVRFRTPMARAAVYGAATAGDRRRAHRALAQATDARSDPERRAWHRACGASAPDEGIAAELERSAQRAAAGGGLAAAAAFLRRAATLTPEPRARARRALDAAEATRRAGDAEAALQVLITAETVALDAVDRARADLVRARLAAGAGADGAPALLYGAARRLAAFDGDGAREAYLDALGATVVLGAQADADPVAIALDALAVRRAGPPRPVDLLLDGLALQVTAGPAAAARTLEQALAAFDDDGLPPDLALDWGWLAAYVAAARWNHATHRALAERLARVARRDGGLATLPHTLTHLIGIHLLDGDLAEAGALMREVEAAVVATGGEPPARVAMLAAAYRGREEDARRVIDAAAQRLADPRRGLGAVVVQWARMLLFNGLGRYEDALDAGRGPLDASEPVGAPAWTLPELVEAASRAGAAKDAALAMSRLSEHARVCGGAWALGLEARSRALLSRGERAECLYREAIARLGTPGSRVDLARAHLLYGEWLRREGRRADARKELRHAHDRFVEMGIEAFAERAGRELRATGETTRRRGTDTRDDLTAQELQIARLAREGLSNQQIGARLFISPRTAEWHLRKVFVKLGISSRVALRDALPDRAPAR